tara:strand:- start:367 stop:825 length:459 start_codon:yes stop_codon:yes gene_type:complete
MKKNKSFAGYINLKPVNGVIFPSSIQNIMMKDYVNLKLKGKFFLSPTEVLQAKYSITLNTLMSNNVKVSGIVMLSSFMLPKTYDERLKIYKNSINNRKELHFIMDEIIFSSTKDIDRVENQLIFREDFFTKTRFKLSSFEKNLIKKYKNSFV